MRCVLIDYLQKRSLSVWQRKRREIRLKCAWLGMVCLNLLAESKTHLLPGSYLAGAIEPPSVAYFIQCVILILILVDSIGDSVNACGRHMWKETCSSGTWKNIPKAHLWLGD